MNFQGRVTRGLWSALGLIVVLLLAGSVCAQQYKSQPKQTPEWKAVEDVFGFPGDALPEGVIRSTCRARTFTSL